LLGGTHALADMDFAVGRLRKTAISRKGRGIDEAGGPEKEDECHDDLESKRIDDNSDFRLLVRRANHGRNQIPRVTLARAGAFAGSSALNMCVRKRPLRPYTFARHSIAAARFRHCRCGEIPRRAEAASMTPIVAQDHRRLTWPIWAMGTPGPAGRRRCEHHAAVLCNIDAAWGGS